MTTTLTQASDITINALDANDPWNIEILTTKRPAGPRRRMTNKQLVLLAIIVRTMLVERLSQIKQRAWLLARVVALYDDDTSLFFDTKSMVASSLDRYLNLVGHARVVLADGSEVYFSDYIAQHIEKARDVPYSSERRAWVHEAAYDKMLVVKKHKPVITAPVGASTTTGIAGGGAGRGELIKNIMGASSAAAAMGSSMRLGSSGGGSIGYVEPSRSADGADGVSGIEAPQMTESEPASDDINMSSAPAKTGLWNGVKKLFGR